MSKKKNKRIPKDVSRIDFKDAQKPIDITLIGTDDDPCFGKLYEPITEECHACGDSELCAIVHMHTMDQERKKAEKKSKFKDSSKPVKTPKFMSTTKLCSIIEKNLKRNKKKRFKLIANLITNKYDPNGMLPEGRVSELCKYAIKMSDKLKAKKKNGKVYIIYVGKS